MWLLGRKENVKKVVGCLEFYYVWGGFLFDAKLLFKIVRKNLSSKSLKTTFAVSTSSVKKVNLLIFAPFLCTIFCFFLYRLFHLSKFLIFPAPIPTPWFLYLNIVESLWSYLRQHNYRVKQKRKVLYSLYRPVAARCHLLSDAPVFTVKKRSVFLCFQFSCGTLILSCLV